MNGGWMALFRPLFGYECSHGRLSHYASFRGVLCSCEHGEFYPATTTLRCVEHGLNPSPTACERIFLRHHDKVFIIVVIIVIVVIVIIMGC